MYFTFLRLSLIIFTITFIFGTLLDNLFGYMQKRNPNIHRYIYGTLQLLTVISLSYYLPGVYTREMGINTPVILFSSFLINLQKNMFVNFDY